jgi:thymidylate kinase
MDRPGLLIAIEGTDSTQESAQFALLRDHLREAGHDVAVFSFPRIDQPSGHFVKEYLSGGYGPPETVGPYSGALFFALDRYQTVRDIKQALEQGKVVLTRGYAGSNMAYQGSLFTHPEERRGFFIWLDNLEFQTLGIPRPDKSIVLRSVAQADIPDLVQVYDDICQLFPKDFTRIDCERGQQVLDSQAVQRLIRETVEPLLPAISSPGATTAVSEFNYFTPPELDTATARLYTQKMDELAKIYDALAHKLTKHLDSRAKAEKALRRVLPLAFVSSSSDQPIGRPFIEKASTSDLTSIAQKHLVNQLAPVSKAVDLVGVQPRNELELTADILYQESTLSLRDIRAEVDNWSYEQKAQALEAFLDESNADSSIREKIEYSWDLLTSFETFTEFVELGVGQGLSWQILTPRYGYKMPQIIEDANLAEPFEQCFDISLALYSQLQEAGYNVEAQYVTLTGHRVRWQVSYNGRQAMSLQSLTSTSPGLSNLLQVMRQKMAEVHPILYSKLT